MQMIALECILSTTEQVYEQVKAENAHLQERCSELQYELAQEREAHQKTQYELRKTYQEYLLSKAETRLANQLDEMPSSIYSSTAKSVARVLSRRFNEDDTGWYEIKVPRTAMEIGQEKGAVYTALHQMEAVGAISLRSDKVPGTKGTRNFPTEVKFHESFWHPYQLVGTVPTSAKRNQGGDRPGSGRPKTCIHCGSEDIVFMLKVHCKDCGRDWNYEVNKNQVDSLVAPAHQHTENQVDSLVPQHAFERLYQEIIAGQAAEENQVDSCETEQPTCEQDGVVIEQEETPIQLEQPADEQNEQSEQCPGTPPPSCEELLDFMLIYAGNRPGSQPAYMKKDGPSKYLSIPGEFDMRELVRKHGNGERTIATDLWRVTSANTRALTRVLLSDCDSEEETRQAEEATRLLAQAGWKPLIGYSPSQRHKGGCYIKIILTADRAKDDILAAILTIAPMFPTREVYPRGGINNRVRLPGGFYCYGGINTWCKEYDADGNELSHDGWSAFRACYEHQTDASLIVEGTVTLVQPKEENPIRGGGYLDTPTRAVLPTIERTTQQGMIAHINATLDMNTLIAQCGGLDGGKFLAIWRDDNNPNVSPWNEKVKDFSDKAWHNQYIDKCELLLLITYAEQCKRTGHKKSSGHYFSVRSNLLDALCMEYRVA